jgi:hypothetical protein
MRRSKHIIRAACLKSIRFEVTRGHSFLAVAHWEGGGHTKVYSWVEHFKPDGQYTKRVCQIARELIAELLQKRGI